MFLRKLRTYLLAGVVVLLPVWLSFFTVIWLFTVLDTAVADPIRAYLPFPLPGLGVVLAFVVTLLAGWLTTHLLGQQLISWAEKAMLRIPVVRALYSAMKQVTEAVLSPREQAFSRVVMIEFPRAGSYCLGFVAGEVPGSNLLRVWVPPGPSPSAGFALLLREDQTVLLPMAVDEGLKFVVSCGVLMPKDHEVPALVAAAAEFERRNQGTIGGGPSE